jgi:hypothetical protein
MQPPHLRDEHQLLHGGRLQRETLLRSLQQHDAVWARVSIMCATSAVPALLTCKRPVAKQCVRAIRDHDSAGHDVVRVYTFGALCNTRCE